MLFSARGCVMNHSIPLVGTAVGVATGRCDNKKSAADGRVKTIVADIKTGEKCANARPSDSFLLLSS